MERRIMKKILITGGTGTVGRSFIKKYYDDYEFYSISRNETAIADLKRAFPKVNCYIGDIRDLDHMTNLFFKISPDIVIHAAAVKHINLAEENPTSAIEVNILGSLNVAKASIRASVPITVGISTDKACNPDSVYGYTKKMMESMFMQYHNQETKFVSTRFANVANSNGSVIPFWLSESDKGNPLKLTDPEMNRLMFSRNDAAELIWMAIASAMAPLSNSFVLCKIMKNVNMLELANMIGNGDVEVVGKRPGEKLNETLISKGELPYTHISDEGYVFISPEINEDSNSLEEEHSSANAECMTTKEMKDLVWTK